MGTYNQWYFTMTKYNPFTSLNLPQRSPLILCTLRVPLPSISPSHQHQVLQKCLPEWKDPSFARHSRKYGGKQWRGCKLYNTTPPPSIITPGFPNSAWKGEGGPTATQLPESQTIQSFVLPAASISPALASVGRKSPCQSQYSSHLPHIRTAGPQNIYLPPSYPKMWTQASVEWKRWILWRSYRSGLWWARCGPRCFMEGASKVQMHWKRKKRFTWTCEVHFWKDQVDLGPSLRFGEARSSSMGLPTC